MKHQTGGVGTRPRGTLAAVCQTGLAVALLGACCASVGHGFSSVISCPVDLFSCLANTECDACLDALGDAGLTVGGFDFELCSELYADVCVTAGSIGCDTDNPELADLLTCVAEDQYGCNDFTTCEEAIAASGSDGLFESTEAPAPALSPVAATPAPDPTDPTPVPTTTAFYIPANPIASAAPTSGPRGGILPPTPAPTSSGTGTLSTAQPTSFLLEFTTDSTTSSATSAAPTPASADGHRGGIGNTFSVSPTAAPTGVGGVDGREDGASGGIASRPSGSAVACSAVLVTAFAGLTSARAAWAA